MSVACLYKTEAPCAVLTDASMRVVLMRADLGVTNCMATLSRPRPDMFARHGVTSILPEAMLYNIHLHHHFRPALLFHCYHSQGAPWPSVAIPDIRKRPHGKQRPLSAFLRKSRIARNQSCTILLYPFVLQMRAIITNAVKHHVYKSSIYEYSRHQHSRSSMKRLPCKVCRRGRALLTRPDALSK